MEQKNQKNLLVLKIIAFEPGSTNSHNPQQDTSHWQSICYQATLTFNISLRKAYCKACSLILMKNKKKVL